MLESRSFTEKEALDLKLIDLVVKDVDELLRALDGREVTRFDGSKVTLKLAGQRTVVVAMNWRQLVLSVIARPEVLFLLLLGRWPAWAPSSAIPACSSRASWAPSASSSSCSPRQIIPVNGAGVLLIVLAVALFAAEVKVTSYGLLTVGGLVAMILGRHDAGGCADPRDAHPALLALLPRRAGHGGRHVPAGAAGGGGAAAAVRDRRGGAWSASAAVAAEPLDPEGWVLRARGALAGPGRGAGARGGPGGR